MRPRAPVLAVLALAAIGAPAAHGASRPGPQALDGRFGSCGLSQDRISEVSAAERVAIAPDGSAVVAGTAGDFSTDKTRVLLRRLRPDGSIDPSFADKGLNVAQVPFANGQQANYLALTGLAIAGDGKILVSGFAKDSSSDDNSAAFLARFNVDGTLDGSFGSGGLVLERLQAAAADLVDLAIAPDGKIVAAGARATGRDDPEARGLVVARFNPDGTPDVAFGSNGVAAPDLGDLKPTRAAAVRLLANGRILVGGQAGEQFALARLTAAGELDPSFASGGVNVTSPPASSSLTTMEVDGAGRIVAAGTASNVNAEGQLVLARYLPQGTLDPSFGAGGFTVDRRASNPGALALSSDGAILATGKILTFSADLGYYELGGGLLRYSANGKRDASFGAGGALAVLSSRIETNDVVLAPDGTAVAAQALDDTFTVSRYVVGQPALAAIAGLPRICRLAVGSKTIARVLRRKGDPSLRVSLLLTRPAELRVGATVLVGGRRAKLGTATERFEGAGSVVAALKVPPSAVRLLRGASKAEVQVSAQATDGGPVTTATRTLGR